MRHTRTRLWAALAAATMLISACGTDPDKQDPQQVPLQSQPSQPLSPPAPITADPARSAEDTMVLVAETVLTVYPQSDEPGDSWWRADDVLSPGGQFPHRGEQVAVPRGRGQWFDWRNRGVEEVQANVTVTNDDRPADTDTVAARVLEVQLTERTGTGPGRLAATQTYYATVTRDTVDDPWRLDVLMQP